MREGWEVMVESKNKRIRELEDVTNPLGDTRVKSDKSKQLIFLSLIAVGIFYIL